MWVNIPSIEGVRGLIGDGGLRIREGDFVESREGLIFDVKGLIHPPNRAVAFVRYIPDTRGGRERGGVRYRKVYGLSERYEFLQRNYPQYLYYDQVFGMCLNGAPLRSIVRCYKPRRKKRQLLHKTSPDKVEQDALKLLKYITEASRIPWDGLGISGSVLVGLQSDESDVDIIVYGKENSYAVNRALRKLLQEERGVEGLPLDFLRRRYSDRHEDTPLSFEDYSFHERRKGLQGVFKGREFFVRYVKEWSEVDESYGDVVYRNLGCAEIEGRVVDDSESLFTPCTYSLADVKVVSGEVPHSITEASSFRGRFCEQALRGEWIAARGKLERITRDGEMHHRLLLGNDPGDYMLTLRSEGFEKNGVTKP